MNSSQKTMDETLVDENQEYFLNSKQQFPALIGNDERCDFLSNKSTVDIKANDSEIRRYWTRSARLKTLRRMTRMMASNLTTGEKSTHRDLCSICLGTLSENEGLLKCSHSFCLACIKNWAQYTNTCPLCKEEFLEITPKSGESVGVGLKVEPKTLSFDEEFEDDTLSESDDVCEICEKNDHPHLLLICDKCNFFVCHTYCANPPLDRIPEDDWFCSQCSKNLPRVPTPAKSSEVQRLNLRERMKKPSEKPDRKKGILTRSCYMGREFEYRELSEENEEEEGCRRKTRGKMEGVRKSLRKRRFL